MEENNDVLEGDILDKTGQVLGIERKYVVPVVLSTALLVGIAVFIAVVSVGDVRNQFLGGPEAELREIKRLRDMVVEIEAGGTIPDVASGEALPRNERCGSHLSGEAGMERGWLWIEEEELCRRIHRSRR